jgi:hypothetical protein
MRRKPIEIAELTAAAAEDQRDLDYDDTTSTASTVTPPARKIASTPAAS